MERAQYTVTVDIVNTGAIKTQLRLKQGDSGIPLYIKVENNGNPYYDPEMQPQVYFKRPDGGTVIGTAVPGNDNKYLYVFKGNELQASGYVHADVKFKHANGRESTSTFIFECIKDTIGKTTENSRIVWNDVVEALAKAEVMLKDVEQTIARMTEQATKAANSAEAAAASEESVEENAAIAKECAEQTMAAVGCAEEAAKSAEAALAAAETASKDAATATEKAAEATTDAESAGEYASSAQYYYEQAKSISESISGALRPKGTITFSELDLETAAESDMYNISDSFTTTEMFKEGAGHIIPAGSNVYKTSDGLWDVLAGSPVSGVKGANEALYRTGNVEITPDNIGLGNVDNTSDKDKPISDATQTALDAINSNLLQKMPNNFKVQYLGTGAKTTVKIKFKSTSSFAFLFGRHSGNSVICASISYIEVIKLGNVGEFSANEGTITCKLGVYAMCHLFHNDNIESIEYLD